MSLSLDSRHCGRVFLVKCAGRRSPAKKLLSSKACIHRGLRESMRIVVQADEVTRVDSTGMGLLVRFLSHTRNRGGDLRLAGVPPFFGNLLRLTKLSTIFRITIRKTKPLFRFSRSQLSPARAPSVGAVSFSSWTSQPTCARL